MARLSFALPLLERCERPSAASVRAWRLQPGRLAQGPEEKCGMAGRTPGILVMALSFQIEAPRWGGVARGGYSEPPEKPQYVQTFENSALQVRVESDRTAQEQANTIGTKLTQQTRFVFAFRK